MLKTDKCARLTLIPFQRLLKILEIINPQPSTSDYLIRFFQQTFFLKLYFIRNEYIWQEGLLLDFLQKKFIDKWVRKFLVTSAYLVNERLFFDWVIRFYLDLVVWAGQVSMIFEFQSIGSTLLVIMLLFSSVYLFLLTLFFIM